MKHKLLAFWQRGSVLFLSAFAMLYLTGCRIGGDLNQVFRNARSFSLPAILVLIINIYFMVKIFESGRSLSSKIMWLAILWFFPVVGALCYWFFAHEAKPKTA